MNNTKNTNNNNQSYIGDEGMCVPESEVSSVHEAEMQQKQQVVTSPVMPEVEKKEMAHEEPRSKKNVSNQCCNVM